MKAMSNKDFAEAVLRMASEERPFKPTATYIPDGDCVEVVLAPDDYYARRIDGLLTVYYSRDTDEIVGSLIKGIGALCRRVLKHMPGFRITVEDKPVKLEHIFLAQLWIEPRDPKDLPARTYTKLIEAAKQEDIEVDLCQTT